MYTTVKEWITNILLVLLEVIEIEILLKQYLTYWDDTVCETRTGVLESNGSAIN